MTHIEDVMERMLQSMNLEYVRECPIGLFTVDFYLVDKKLVIECDGEKFHHNKWQTEQRDKALKRSGEVMEILHFRGRHILKYQKDVRKSIKNTILSLNITINNN